jgi:hypothetical protein
MKKIAISLIALTAISTVSFAAGNRNNELRDSETYFGKYSSQLMDKSVNANAMTVIRKTGTATNFDRLNWTAWANDQGGRH